jgi:glucosamine-6-phosphate deaminase
MDEYIGLTQDSPQSFSYFLTEHLFKAVKPRKVHLMNKYQNVVLAQQQYANLVSEAPIDIVCLGVGENGHLAFNDPPVADFNDRKLIKVVTLDEACRCQQVNDGCFKEIEQVPERALTLTIPALLSGKFLFCVVPGKSKSEAIKNLVEGEIATSCPASILRTHNNCTLYVDEDAYTKITN